MKTIIRLITAFALLPLVLFAVPVRDKQVVAELVAENTSVKPDEPFWVGVKLTMDEHWHTYWVNCGDACQPTTLKWTLPEGFTAGAIQWPAPIRFSISPEVVNYGYEGETMLLVQITPPATLAAGSSVDLKVLAKWLMCHEMCIPGKAELTLSLPSRSEVPTADASHAASFAKSRTQLPSSTTGWIVTTAVEGSSIVLRATPPAGFADEIPGGYFYILDDLVVKYEGKQVWAKDGSSYKLTVPLADKPEVPASIRGVLVLDGGKVPPIEVGAAVPLPPKTVSAANGDKRVAAPAATSTLSIGTGLLLMFLGGLILNLMPCVFPVLSLKIVGFVEHAKEGGASAKAHAGAFTAGVLVSMWILAGLLLALRGQGGTQGWAFQMSNPTFVLCLIFLFLLIGLNMFGVFELGVGVTSAGSNLQDRKGLAGSFFSGLLTTVAGAPCAGPFLGTAIGFALAQSAPVAMLAFTAMGAGTALPYVVLSTNPALLRILPRPGAWMETMKQLMGFPMVATAAWFGATLVKLQGGSDLGTQADLRVEAMKALLFGAVAVAIGAWVFGKWAAIHREPRTRWIARIATLALIAAGGWYALQKPATVFEPWDPAKLAALREKGKPVFVDFTAEWCAICQVNKHVIEKPDVLAKFKEKNVTLMIADWTDQNERVGAGLKEFGRDAVPLYLLYSPDASKPPQILPQALTPGIISDALDKL